jgi:hypothetical protein
MWGVMRAPLLLLLYQVAPITTQRDSLGRVRVTVGFGAGQWENERFDCNGQLVSAGKVPFTTGGAQVDVWPSPHVRVTAFAGGFHPTDNSTVISPTRDYSGPFGGGQVAYEAQRFGIGMGWGGVVGQDAVSGPAFYMRVGNMDGVYLRGDAVPPSPTFATAGWARAGVGFHEGHLRRLSGFVGVALPPPYNTKAQFTGYLRVPVAKHVSLHLDGIVGPGEAYTQGGAAVGVRFDY